MAHIAKNIAGMDGQQKSSYAFPTLTKIQLANQFVRLVPIETSHASEFAIIGKDPSIWQYLTPEPLNNEFDALAWIEQMMHRPDQAVTYSVFDVTTGRLAGSTSFMNVSETNNSLEIGFTWYGKQYQRTYVNTATKFALLTHAFDTLGACRVQLQTDSRNSASQNAIKRIGGRQEGVLRKHKKYPSGYTRDSAVFSIIDDEWPAVRTNLRLRLFT